MLAASITPEVEPNDDRFFATQLAPAEAPANSGYLAAFASGNIDAGNSDYFTFTALAGDRIVVAAEADNSSLDPEIVLRNSAGGELRSDRDSGAGSDSLTQVYTVPTSGRFYIEVLGDTDTTSGGYQFRVDIARGINLEWDQNYRNDSLNNANSLDFAQTGALKTASVAGTVMATESTNTDQDVFNLGFMRASSSIDVSLQLPAWSTLSPILEILDGSGAIISSAADGTLTTTTTAPSDGNYYARVRTEIAIINGSRFSVIGPSNDWGIVRAEAQAAGGDLASIASAEENQLIYDTLGGGRWIGFTDQDSEGNYQWTDGSPVTYTRWAGNEPNTPSYDYAYMETNGLWYDLYPSNHLSGIMETAAEPGDPLIAGAGVQAQYVLDASVELRDLVPPVVTAIGRLPDEGGTLERVLSTFSVTLSELDPDTLSDDAFDLRAAGPDGLFETADDAVYGLSYSRSNQTLNFTITDGPLADGNYRLTVADSLTDLPVADGVSGNALDGDNDGSAGGDFVRLFTVDAVADGEVFEGADNGSYENATPLALIADANGTGWLRSEVGRGSIDPAPNNSYGEYDWWSFEGQAGDRVDVWGQQLIGDRPSIQLYRLNDAGDGVISLASDGLNDSGDGPNNDVYISGYGLPATTTYFVIAGKYRWDDAPVDYDLRVNVARGTGLETDANYVNDSINGADGLPFEQTGALRSASVAGTVMATESSNTDQDVFQLGFMRADSLISLALDRPEWSEFYPTLEILDSSGSVLANTDGSGPLSLDYTATVDGHYYARVRTAFAINNGSRFSVIGPSNDWGIVRAEAQAAGGDLASIASAEENQLIYDTLGGGRWIGFTDQDSEGNYQWTDGSPVTYTRWAGNEPNTPSYDYAYMETNGLWYDLYPSNHLSGIMETAAEPGDPLIAGAGVQAQYVLDASVELRDLVPPVVTAIGRLPDEGGTLERVLSTFSVTLSELDPDTLSDDAFDLRAAGPDGLFETADDAVYGLSYSRSNQTLNFTITDGPLADGNYRLTVADSLTDLPVADGVSGNALDGDNDGSAGGDFVRLFTVDAVADGEVFEGADNGSYENATPLALIADANGTGWLRSEVGRGSIDPAPNNSYGEYDWWSFEGQAGDRVDVWGQQLIGDRPSIQLYRLNDAGDGVISLASDGLNDSGDGPNNDVYISGYGLPATTTYFVIAGKYRWDDAPVDYDLRVNVARGTGLETDANYVNDSINGADGLPFEQTGALRSASVAGTVMATESSNTDQDVFQLGFMRADSLISLALDRPEWSEFYPTLEILDSSGSVLANTDGSGPLSLDYTATVDGHYYARVRTAFAINNGSRFSVIGPSNDWGIVRAEAQAAGGDLASIASAEENQLIYDTLGGGRWIGFTDQDSEGNYQWTDGSPVTYTRWAGNEPNTPSYDYAYMETNGLWYDLYPSNHLSGIMETAAEPGDPLIAGAGVQAQYVLDASVELRDLVPPVVTAIGRLPDEGGTLERVLSTFSVTLSELDPDTLSDDAFDLRAAGPDGLFETADDAVYGLSYSRSNQTLNFTITDGPLADGNYRLTVADSLTDLPVADGVSGNALDGDNDGSAGGDFVRLFTVDAVADGEVFEGADNGSYENATPLALIADANGTGWLRSEVGRGSIDPAPNNSYGEYDWWSFEGQAGDRVDVWGQQLIGDRPSIQLYRLNDAGDGVISLASDGLNDSGDGPNNDVYISGYGLPATTTYFVIAGKYRWDDAPVDYDLRVNVARGTGLETDANYVNDSINGADGLPFEQTGALRSASVAGTVMATESSNTDQDVFQLGFMRADSLISLALDRPEWSEFYPTLEILDSSGSVLANTDGSGPLSLDYTATVDGHYYARVRTAFAINNGSRFSVIGPSNDWGIVRAEAQAAGGDLASIASAEENQLIYDTLGGGRWIGFTDQDSEGNYQWTDGSPVTYTRWAGNEPNTPSYDYAYMETNGLWYDLYPSNHLSGIMETAAEPGDPLIAGAGVQAQYVLDASVELRDLVPPVVTAIGRLPDEGGTLERVLSTFSVTLSELDPDTLSDDAFDLRAAGPDGLFETADDAVYGLSYSRSNQTLNFTITDGPLADGNYRLTVADSLTDLPVADGVSGNALDGDNDGSAGGDFVRLFTVDAVADGEVFEGADNGSYENATPLALIADANGTGWLRSEVGRGSIDPAPNNSYGEYDWWSFEGQAGDRVDVWGQQLIGDRPSIQLYRLNDAGDGVISLASDGLNDSGDGPNNDVYISGYGLPATTTYFVIAGKYRWDDAPVDYDLRVNVARGIDLETDANYANETVSQADSVTRHLDGDTVSITVGGTIMKGEGSEVDEDFFNLGSVDSGQTILARIRLPDYSTLTPALEIRSGSNQVISLSPNPVDANVVRADITEAGTYYVDVVGFAGEGPWANYVVDVSIQPTSSLDFADLSIASVSISDDAPQSGQTVQIDWNVGNFGAVDTQSDQWMDTIILSSNDQLGDGDDIILTSHTHTGVLAVGQNYNATASVEIPIGLSGDYHLFIKTDYTDQVAEFLFEDNNVRSLSPLSITLTPYADLAVDQVFAGPDPSVVGESALVTWRVTNQGTGTTGDGRRAGSVSDWRDRLYLSTDMTFGNADDVIVAEVEHNTSLAAGESYYGQWSGNIPSGLDGDYYWFVLTDSDNAIYEHDDHAANIAAGNQVSIAPSRFVDLIPSAITAPATATSDDSITVSWTTTNDGIRSTNASWMDRIYLSSDPVLDASDVVLGTFNSNLPLEIGQSTQYSADVVLPSRLEGDFYLLVQVNHNGSQFEFNNADNNIDASNLLRIDRRLEPDLTPTSASVPATIIQDNPFSFTYSVANAGDGPTYGTWYDQIFLSPDEVFDPSDVSLTAIFPGAYEVTGLDANGDEYTLTAELSLPSSIELGRYHLLVVSDFADQELETDENNNTLASTAFDFVERQFADLVVTGGSIQTPAMVHPGAAFTISWSVENEGVETADGPWVERVYLSDSTSGGHRQLMGTFTRNDQLTPGSEPLLRSETLTLPVTGLAGETFFVVELDAFGQIEESDEQNDFWSESGTQIPIELTLSGNTTQIAEGGTGTQLQLSRNGSTSEALVVAISVDQSGQVSLANEVTIPAGVASVTIPVQAIVDQTVDGDQPVTITASAAGFPDETYLLSVIDTDILQLHVEMSVDALDEGQSTPVTVTHNGPTDSDLLVDVASDSPSDFSFPDQITILAGQSSATFTIVAVQDDLIEGDELGLLNLSAPGYPDTAAALSINQSDLPTIALSLPASIDEGTLDGSVTGQVSIGVPRLLPTQIQLTSSDEFSLFVLPTVTIPAGATSADFTLASLEDGDVNGDRTVTISASALPDQGGPAIPSTTVDQTTVVIDNDGPKLTFDAFPLSMDESGSGTVTVTQNGVLEADLIVELTSSDSSEMSVPPTVTIPAGLSSATFVISGVPDAVVDGDQLVALTATAPGFPAASVSLTITDSDGPDLVVDQVEVPTAATIGDVASVQWRVMNDGTGDANGSWAERLFWSTDQQGSNGLPVETVAFEGTLQIGQSYSRTANVSVPELPGQYYLMVQVDPNDAIAESLESNNIAFSGVAISIAAPYSATVTAAIDSAPVGTSIPLSGVATNTDGTPASSVDVEIQIWVRGTRRVISTSTDSDGAFSTTFVPFSNEGGNYSVAAVYPGVTAATPQDTFQLLGLQPTRGVNQISLPLGESTTQTIRIKNLADVGLTGLTVDAFDVTGGLTVTPAVTGGSTGVSPSGSFEIEYDLTGIGATPGSVGFVLRIHTNEAPTLEIPISVVLLAESAHLVADIGTLTTTMTVGQQKVLEFTLENRGGAPSGPLEVLLPDSAGWLSVGSGRQINSLAAGESAKVTLLLSPQSDLALTRYQGLIVVQASNSNLPIGFDIRAISDEVGGLKVNVVDEFYYYANDKPLVTTADLLLRDAISNDIVFDSRGSSPPTGDSPSIHLAADGSMLLTDVPAGKYYLEVSAADHDSYRELVEIESGETMEVTAFISRDFVEYTWTVEEIAVEDRTRITIDATFETNVPAPVVVVDASIDLKDLDRIGETQLYEIKYTNHGLVQATDIAIFFDEHPFYEIVPLVDAIPVLPANSSVTIPVRVTRVNHFVSQGGSINDSESVPCSINAWTQYCYQSGPRTVCRQVPILVYNVDGNCSVSTVSSTSVRIGNPRSSSNTGGTAGYGSTGGFGGSYGPAVPIGGLPGPIEVFSPPTIKTRDECIDCATVRLQVSQDVVQTRQAFQADLEIDNPFDTESLESLGASVQIIDAQGTDRSDLFGITFDTRGDLTGIDGSGTLAAESNGGVTWLIVPSSDAATTGPMEYFVTGTLSYRLDGRTIETAFTPINIQVLPIPELYLDYFWQRDVVSDDPYTAEIEPTETFSLGVQIRNDGAGIAHQLRIESARPKIIENEDGLLIDFEIVGASVNGQPAERSLTASFGELGPGELGTAEFLMESTLQGLFTEYNARFEHLSDFGRPDISLIKDVQVHELIRTVNATSSGVIDNIPDFLANDVADPDDLPDTLYLSDGTSAPVSMGTDPLTIESPTLANLTVPLAATMPDGWSYLALDDPSDGAFELVAIRRDDGSLLPMKNFWQSDRTFVGMGQRPIYENRLHLLDFDSTGSYELVFSNGDVTGPDIRAFSGIASPINAPATSLLVEFDETINPATVSADDFRLLLNGQPITSWIPQINVQSGHQVRVDDLAEVTAQDGVYAFEVNLSTIEDVVGNTGENTRTFTWVKGEAAPATVEFIGVPTGISNELPGSVQIRLTEDVELQSLIDAFFLADDGETVSTAELTFNHVENALYEIGNLDAAIDSDGTITLAIDGSQLIDLGGTGGVGYLASSWVLDRTDPEVVEVIDPATNPRNIVVQQIDVQFSEPIDRSTFTVDDIRLTRDTGTVNLIADDSRVVVSDQGGGRYRISGISWAQGFVATPQIASFSLSIFADDIMDLAGNTGSGHMTASWTIDLDAPVAPADLVFLESGRPVAGDVVSSGQLIVEGDLAESGLAVVIRDMVNDRQLAIETISGTQFSIPIDLETVGRHDIEVRVIDPAGNVTRSEPRSLTLLADPVVLNSIIGLPEVYASEGFDEFSVRFASPIDPSSVSTDSISIRQDDGSNLLLQAGEFEISADGQTLYVKGIQNAVASEGRYEVSIDLSQIRTQTGGTGSGIITRAWTLDSQSPESRVLALAVNQRAPTFELRLETSDPILGNGNAGSGIASVDLFVSTNGGDYRHFQRLSDVFETTFTGEEGFHYEFFSVAIDRAGNIEALPNVADAATQTGPFGPQIVDATIQDGLTSRSYVDSLQIKFDRETNVSNLLDEGVFMDAVSLLRFAPDGSEIGELTLAPNQFLVDFTDGVPGETLRWSLDSFSGSKSTLPDGYYIFKLNAIQITSGSGFGIDGDADGLSGGDYQLGFHVLSGDTDGNGMVDNADMLVVLGAIGRSEGMPGFDPNADLDRDGRITVRDRILVAQSFGRSTSAPEPVASNTAAVSSAPLTSGSPSPFDQADPQDAASLVAELARREADNDANAADGLREAQDLALQETVTLFDEEHERLVELLADDQG